MKVKTKIFVVGAMLLASAGASAATIGFTGTSNEPVVITPEASTGLDAVYVLRSTVGVEIQVTVQSEATLYKFGNLGGAYAQPIVGVGAGATISTPVQGDMGYIVEEAGRRSCIWVVDYAAHELRLDALEVSAQSDCSRTLFTLTGSAGEIGYYTINGRRRVLSREMTLDYSTLAFDASAFSYVPSAVSTTLDALDGSASVPAPLCPTTISVSGDRFLRAWGMEETVQSPLYTSPAVEASTRAIQTPHTADNEQRGEADGLGGSAPCEVTFEAAVSDGAVFTEWQISRSAQFDPIDNTYSDLSLTYTFTEQGSTYVRFVADNADGTCPFESETYRIDIGESKLEIPNAFTPQGSPGVNDEWKVSYSSLISFECRIYNRWGKELFHTTDPSRGWDGKSGGKFVPAGVYYYVISARGADGKDYKRAGDINIINFKEGTRPGTDAE